MVSVRVKNLRKTYGDVVAVDNVSFEVEAGELFFLLGPSGCGKTTILRAIAGLCETDEGEIYFDDRRIDDLPPHKRNTAMVFQSYALWPHLTVWQNVQYGLDVRGLSRSEKRQRVQKALEMVRMSDVADRNPAELSGGQQQRVALARAIVVEPDVILLDEPLSNLDARLRIEMRNEIRRIHSELRITMIYVTHDQKEALSMAQRVAVMSEGRIEQIGSPKEVYEKPRNRFVAEFIGEANLISGKVKETAGDAVIVATEIGDLKSLDLKPRLAAGAEVVCCIRPEAVRIGSGEGAENRLKATIESATYLGESEQYLLRIGDTSLKAVVLNPSRPPMERRSEIAVSIPPSEVVLLTE